MKVYAFDRDLTVDVNQGPVPLSEVRRLAHETHHEVWAIGNQRLKREADIPGIEEALERLRERIESEPDVERRTSHASRPGRKKRLLLIEELFPDAEEYVHVDDVNVRIAARDRWTYYRPAAFVEERL